MSVTSSLQYQPSKITTVCTYFFILSCATGSEHGTTSSGWGQRKAWLYRTYNIPSKTQEFYNLKVNFKPAGIELEFQHLWKESTNNKNCSWFHGPGMKCCNISIIPMWVHVIYLQLELLSIQQPKSKNCRYIADETTLLLSQLWPVFS